MYSLMLGAYEIRWMNWQPGLVPGNSMLWPFSETWIEQGQEWLLQVPGFSCFTKCREGGKRGGGGIVSQGQYYGGRKEV